jgi:hypothetical protein
MRHLATWAGYAGQIAKAAEERRSPTRFRNVPRFGKKAKKSKAAEERRTPNLFALAIHFLWNQRRSRQKHAAVGAIQ